MKSIAQIAAQLQDYDPQALSAQAVQAFLAQLVEPVTQTQTVGIFEALGRVLAQDLVSPLNVPPHHNSAMDGFAFDSAALHADQALILRVVGTAAAGRPAPAGPIAAHECIKIMTGAVMPEGLDTVVPLELVQEQGACITIPPGAVRPTDNLRRLGEDLRAGEVALPRGHTLGPAALGLIASLGLAQVEVYRRIKVAYFSTGDEILSLGQAPREGAVYDSNRYTLFGLLSRLGVELIDLGVVSDQPAAIEAALLEAGAQADAIITSGGVSMGEADHTKAIMKKLGDVAFWRIAMRPGRPMAVGQLHRLRAAPPSNPAQGGRVPLLFGLPGNPVAVMVTFLAFVRPALQRLMGAAASQPVWLQAHCTQALRKKPGRTEYQRGIVTRNAQGQLQVRTTGDQGSGVLRSMVQANGLIVLHHHQPQVSAGQLVDVMMFEGCI